jgi:dTDP-4-amino-4,6-dideoxygalactose transaminase
VTAARIVPFNQPHLTGLEYERMKEAVDNRFLSGNGPFTARCQAWLEQATGSRRALLTHSCTGALEMASILIEVGPGDEVIMPSFTFVSTANAFVLRGATPVFVDIRGDTLNLDERLVEAAVTSRTRAIVPVHYGGVGCDMDALTSIASRHGLFVVEDAAQAVLARWNGRPLGSIGQLAAVSFHETKNVIAGEGGALLVNDERLLARAEIVWEKGTDRGRFRLGQVDKYTWQDVGSSFQPSEITAAFLSAQLDKAESIAHTRLKIWNRYQEAFGELESRELVRRPVVPPGCEHSGHLYYLILQSEHVRNNVLKRLHEEGVHAIFHYVPLHASDAGRRLGRVAGSMEQTETNSGRLIRLPLWTDMTAEDVDRVIDRVHDAVQCASGAQ